MSSPKDRRQKRLTLAKMSSADMTQRKGFGSALVASTNAWMSRSRASTERWTPRRIARSGNSPNQVSVFLNGDNAYATGSTAWKGRFSLPQHSSSLMRIMAEAPGRGPSPNA